MKLLKENISEQEIDDSININSDVGAAETLMNDQEESLILKMKLKSLKLETNGLENFGLEKIHQIYLKIILLKIVQNNFRTEDENSEEDEFEIPAFLRRQKN